MSKLEKQYIIGIDGGGSKTEAVSTWVNGKIIKRHISGSININSVGLEEATRNLLESLENVKINGKAELCVIGAAGLENERNREEIIKLIDNKYSKRVIIVSDAKIAYETVKHRGNVIVLICGTGSIAYTEVNGRKIRAGGWGYLIGDEGSGFWIAKKALNNMFRRYDEEIPQTQLSKRIMELYKVTSPTQIIEIIYSQRGISEIAKIAEEIAEACEEGDEEAIEIIDEAGRELAKIVKIVIRKSGYGKCEVQCFGGLFKTSKRLLEKIKKELEGEYPEIKVVKCKHRGIAGTILMGLREMGIEINNEIIRNIEEWAYV